MERIMVVSCDCHAGLPIGDFGPYLETKHKDAYEDSLLGAAHPLAKPTNLSDDPDKLMDSGVDLGAFQNDYLEQDAVQAGGATGAWDAARRLKELAADGVVAEVIFPQTYPFGGSFAMGGVLPPRRDAQPGSRNYMPRLFSPELIHAGGRAHNRWLAELISDPERQIGLAVFPTLANIDAVVADLHWAAGAGLRGALLPPSESDLPPLCDARYDPIWAVCQELSFPVHFHGGGGMPNSHSSNAAASRAINLSEGAWYAHRALWILMWGGVFERYPQLKIVFTEQFAAWVPGVLEHMDLRVDDVRNFPAEVRDALRLKPSEYWQRQGFVAATAVSKPELALRNEIGVGTLMFGTDYPHVEGTWPNTREYIHAAFAGVPERETRMILGENSARCYNLDFAKLCPLVEEIGPSVQDVLGVSAELDRIAMRPHVAINVNRSTAFAF